MRSPFLAPEFALAVDRVRRDARVAVLEDSGRVVGFLAYQAATDFGRDHHFSEVRTVADFRRQPWPALQYAFSVHGFGGLRASEWPRKTYLIPR